MFLVAFEFRRKKENKKMQNTLWSKWITRSNVKNALKKFRYSVAGVKVPIGVLMSIITWF
jgi:hypothetical protein